MSAQLTKTTYCAEMKGLQAALSCILKPISEIVSMVSPLDRPARLSKEASSEMVGGGLANMKDGGPLASSKMPFLNLEINPF